MTEWSLSNQFDFLSLRIDQCAKSFHELTTELCSPDRINVAAQIAFCEKLRAMIVKLDANTEEIQKFFQNVKQNGGEDELSSVIHAWGQKIPELRKAMVTIETGLVGVLNGQGADQLQQAIENVDYNLLEMERPTFDKSTFEPITFQYLQNRFDHCLALLQNIFNFFLRRHMNAETANEQMALIKAFNSNFELQKQNISLYESQLYEQLSNQTNDDAQWLENELNLLDSFTNTINLWASLPLNQISGTISQKADGPGSLHNNLYELFQEINFEAIGVEKPTNSELVTLRLNLGWFRPKFQTKKLAWLWVNKMKLMPSEEETSDDFPRNNIPNDAIKEYYIQLSEFMQTSETTIDSFIENLLTLEPDRGTFDAQFAECERLKLALQAQKGQMRTLERKLASLAAKVVENDNDVISDEETVNGSPTSFESFEMHERLKEWIKLVSLWLQVLDSLTSLMSHMGKNVSDSGGIDDIVDSLRQMIERDLFIPTTDTQAEMEQ